MSGKAMSRSTVESNAEIIDLCMVFAQLIRYPLRDGVHENSIMCAECFGWNYGASLRAQFRSKNWSSTADVLQGTKPNRVSK
jgi:hypothetical protein